MTKLLQNNKHKFTFKIADHSNIKDIVRLVESAYRGESSRQGWTTEATFIEGQRTDEREVIELMNKPGSIFILCHDAEKLIGSVQIEKQQDKTYLGMFAVDPERQGDGIGSMLLSQAEAYARDEWVCKAMQMTVITIRKELIDWYVRNGYTPTGELKKFPYEEPRFGKPTRDDLTLETYEKLFNSQS